MNLKSRTLIIHRNYRVSGGEESFLETVLIPSVQAISDQVDILRLPALLKGPRLLADLFELFGMALGWERLRPSYWQIKKMLRAGHFTHAVFSNFIPTVSLAAPQLMKRLGIKTFSFVHNQRLSCANGLRFDGRKTCHECLERGSYRAFLKKCCSSYLQSFVFALAYRKQRVMKKVLSGVDCFIGCSNYSVETVLGAAQAAGFDRVRAVLVRSLPLDLVDKLKAAPKQDLECSSALKAQVSGLPQNFYLFVGRVSYEKGADLFADLAARYPQKGFVLGGDGPLLQFIREKAASLGIRNLVCTGFLGEMDKLWLYSRCEALLIPSRVPENGSMVGFESHPFGTPMVYPAQGGAQEVAQWLGRAGCAWDEFKGQKFERKGSFPADFEGYAEQFKRIMGFQ